MESRILVKDASGAMLDVTEALHPSGACTCAHEGQCEWCHQHCLHCGATKENEIHSKQTCGKPYGEEILLWGMMPGDGLQSVCMYETGHAGDHGDPEMGPHGFLSVAEACAGL